MQLTWPKLSRLTVVGSWLSKSMAVPADDTTETIFNCDGGMSWHLSATGPKVSLECLKGDVTLVDSGERQRIFAGDSLSLSGSVSMFIYGSIRSRSQLRIVRVCDGQVRLLPIPVG